MFFLLLTPIVLITFILVKIKIQLHVHGVRVLVIPVYLCIELYNNLYINYIDPG